MKVLNSELYYTGGGIWCAEGQLEDGSYFFGGDGGYICFDILKQLPYDSEGWAEYYDEETDYFVRHMDEAEAIDLWMWLLEEHKEELFSCDYEHLKEEAENQR